MAEQKSLPEQYAAVRSQRNWRSWPAIRQLRTLWFRRLRPWHEGRSTGLSVIRYYWAGFLEQHRDDIRGHCLEIGETTTIRAYGGNAIQQVDAMDLSAHGEEVRVVADLSRADHVPPDQYDCFVNQFTTAVIYDIEAALYHAIRILKPGGVLLINFWCLDFYLHRGLDMGTAGGDPLYMYWWFTPIQVHDLLRRLQLNDEDVTVQVYGNLLTRMAFLLNMPAREFTPQELNTHDPGQPLLICARIQKPLDWQAPTPVYRAPRWQPAAKPAKLSDRTGHYGDEYVAG